MYSLIAIGIVMTYSASAVYADQYFGSATYFFRRQLFYVLVGTVIFSFLIHLNPDKLKQYAKQLMVLAILMLALVYIPPFGQSAGGARRWIHLVAFNFQPVEYAKLAVCLYLADYLSRKLKPMAEGKIMVLVPPLFVIGTILVLVIAQPDLGSCVFILMVSGLLFFLAGIKLRFVAIATIPVMAGFIFLVISAPYRLNRIAAFLDPWKDPSGSGFQIIQSFLAFALGGINGVGLGQSTQKLFYLPQGYTDFIFSIIGEELGLIGAMTVLILYGVFLLFGIKIVNKCRVPFYRLFAHALVLMIVLQALLNLLVATGMIPTKGLPLPFISYGGTSLIFNMITVAILIAIDRKNSSRSSPMSHSSL